MASPRNSLLQSMPARQFEQIAHLMEPVTLAPRRTLQHANVPIKHVYFVEEGLVRSSRAPTRGMLSRSGWSAVRVS